MADGEQGGLPIDYLPIKVSKIDFSYEDDFDDSTTDKQAFNSSGELVAEQGQLVAILGKPEGGKSTLLKLLGGVVLPKPGGFFLPAHLRVLHVSTDAYFFAGSLYENLTFGVAGEDPDGSMQRVLEVCRKLGVYEKVLHYVQEGPSGEHRSWLDILSQTQKSMCMIARAVIANPEMMCVHKPTLSCDEVATTRVMSVFREFVELKGVSQDASTRHQRRPRTCIITSSKAFGVDVADVVYYVSSEAGIEQLKGEDRKALVSRLG
eukprot:gnl/TRDRNA2_/TRDRNA2_164306_c0_seq1.p1 gnl/TRDRNA2_/TRDRNA2_164306_c0~~gnl/TRDRNA2_/TRDRNA2_164306_c0_seq1.p1  ORF type:complete len:294 (-),score=44.63 gnl/TRDRNA2_/TRDRNA2_164306_c0_seq1:30-818(-)